MPISLIVAALAIGGWLLVDDKKELRFAPRQGLILIAALLCAWITTVNADFPIEALDEMGLGVEGARSSPIFLPLHLAHQAPDRGRCCCS